MNPEKKEFIGLLVSSGCLKFGDFTLKSGVWSPFFMNLGAITSGRQLEQLGAALACRVLDLFPEVTALFGPAYKGIPMVTTTACAMARMGHTAAILYDRKEAKKHGEGGDFIGFRPGVADQVVMIDDVYTSGGTKVDGVRKLKAGFGVDVSGIVVALDRRLEGVEPDPELPALHCLVDMPDLADYLEGESNSGAEAVRRFYRGEQ